MQIDCAPQINIAAYHQVAGFESRTPGIGVLCRDGTYILGAGHYQNSVRRPSNYAMVGWQPLSLPGVRLGAFAGVVTGYANDAIPMLAGAVSVRVGTGELHFTVIPKFKDVSPFTVAVSYSF